ncbi:uncharacterized protein LOC135212743 isoform X2 [Macrobrachium nipponense]|uniref:uncharacterized protein LOC135212743 isoform X2 n=1 Tax=Macrobrachium nipponense TaxID=159736 RepID=UPI0030C84472
MYVIFPLDELLDLNSARENKRGRATLDKQSHTRHTEEVLPLSQPNQLLPSQLKPPLNNPPKSNLQQPTPSPTKQQKAPPTPPQKPPTTPSQKPTLTKTPSKTSISVTPASVAVVVPPSQSPSPPVSANVKKQPSTAQQQQQQQTVASTQPPLDPVTKRQRSSHSTSTETSSTSSTGAKGKALLSPQGSGGPAANRSSWGGSPVSGPFQESCPDRSGSFRAFKDLTVSTDGNSLKIVEPARSESAVDIAGSSQKASQPLRKNNSFRSHLSDSCASRPRQKGVEAIRKPSAALPNSKQPSPSETPKKSQDPVEPTPPSPQSPKAPDTALPKPGTPVQPHKEKQIAGNEGVKIKQEVPVQSAPPPAYPHPHHQPLTAAESLRIQQECLSPTSEAKANSSNQRHPSGRSNRSGSQKLSDLPPSGIGGGSRGATTGTSSSTSSKTQGVLVSPRGLQQQQQQQQQRNSVMASNEPSFRDLTNPSHNESLKAHNAFTFKLVKTGMAGDFFSYILETAVVPLLWRARREPIAGRGLAPSGRGR